MTIGIKLLAKIGGFMLHSIVAKHISNSGHTAIIVAADSIPEFIEVDGKTRPTRNSENKFVSSTLAGIKNFWKWFGDSYVVEQPVSSKQKRDSLRPLVVYHGTKADFSSFAPVRTGNVTDLFGEEVTTTRHGMFFTPSIPFAESFATQRGSGSSNVMPVYLSIKNPAYLDEGFNYEILQELEKTGYGIDELQRLAHRPPHMVWAEFDDSEGAKLIAALKYLGYDGAYIEENGEENTWVAFDPKQIKSATGNVGSFSTSTSIITASNKFH